mmetsp:Transcript_59006/g.175553  ORF Transcript_59006/g.175553 Transcript_59006/m.175553 type:complete len:307 (+) Transcript_59006:710-1630(+)
MTLHDCPTGILDDLREHVVHVPGHERRSHLRAVRPHDDLRSLSELLAAEAMALAGDQFCNLRGAALQLDDPHGALAARRGRDVMGHEDLSADVCCHEPLQNGMDCQLHLAVGTPAMHCKLPETGKQVLLKVLLLGDDVPEQAGEHPVTADTCRGRTVLEVGHVGGVAPSQATDAGVLGQPVGELLEEAHPACEADAQLLVQEGTILKARLPIQAATARSCRAIGVGWNADHCAMRSACGMDASSSLPKPTLADMDVWSNCGSVGRLVRRPDMLRRKEVRLDDTRRCTIDRMPGWTSARRGLGCAEF